MVEVGSFLGCPVYLFGTTLDELFGGTIPFKTLLPVAHRKAAVRALKELGQHDLPAGALVVTSKQVMAFPPSQYDQTLQAVVAVG